VNVIVIFLVNHENYNSKSIKVERETNSKIAKNYQKVFLPKSMSDYHKIHSGVQKHYQQQDLIWHLMKFYLSFETDPKPFLCTFWVKFFYLLVNSSIFRKKAFSLITSAYFSIEKSHPKKDFCIINLVHSQVYRIEKVGKYLLPQSRKSSF
jgi:hypothetical protein